MKAVESWWKKKGTNGKSLATNKGQPTHTLMSSTGVNREDSALRNHRFPLFRGGGTGMNNAEGRRHKGAARGGRPRSPLGPRGVGVCMRTSTAGYVPDDCCSFRCTTTADRPPGTVIQVTSRSGKRVVSSCRRRQAVPGAPASRGRLRQTPVLDPEHIRLAMSWPGLLSTFTEDE